MTAQAATLGEPDDLDAKRARLVGLIAAEPRESRLRSLSLGYSPSATVAEALERTGPSLQADVDRMPEALVDRLLSFYDTKGREYIW